MNMNNARSHDCDEVIMHKANLLTEGGASNIFFATDDCIYTPSLANNILPGITRELLIEEIRNLGLNFEEGDYNVQPRHSQTLHPKGSDGDASYNTGDHSGE